MDIIPTCIDYTRNFLGILVGIRKIIKRKYFLRRWIIKYMDGFINHHVVGWMNFPPKEFDGKIFSK